jgi:hypothetical protein
MIAVRMFPLTPKLNCNRSTEYAAHLPAFDSNSIGGNRNVSADLALVSCSDTLDIRAPEPLDPCRSSARGNP